MQSLSLRLKTIADLVPKGAKVCDVGTDHGYLAIYLKLHNIAKTVIAVDVNEKPLMRAEKNISAAGVSGIELRLCDGLTGLCEGEADAVVIAGIGGEVIAGILNKGDKITKSKDVTLIIQPTTSPEILREFLCKSGFSIEREIPISEKGKVYSVMVCRYKGEVGKKDDSFYYTGRVKPDSDAGVLYIKKQQKRVLQCMTALENRQDKKDLYLRYKNALEGIDKILEQYGE